jgi:hypothetical protein
VGSFRPLGFATVLILLAVASAAPVSATDNKKIPDAALTCEVPGGSFVLDNTDFKALTGPNATSDPSRKGEPALTAEYFAMLKRTSVLRHQICDSRALLRQITSGRCEQEDFKNFRFWVPEFFTDKEQKALIKCQIDIATR